MRRWLELSKPVIVTLNGTSNPRFDVQALARDAAGIRA
jgi:hypothetical protein